MTTHDVNGPDRPLTDVEVTALVRWLASLPTDAVQTTERARFWTLMRDIRAEYEQETTP